MLLTLGCIFLIMLILSFTDIPFYAYYSLSKNEINNTETPKYIIIFGACGMPDPETINRLYYGAKIAHLYPDSKVIIAMTSDSLKEQNNTIRLMTNELIIRGIDSSRIFYEYSGTNTYEQARNTLSLFPDFKTSSIMVVSSPYHMKRIYKVYRKLGLTKIGEQSSYENPLTEDILESDDPEINKNMSLAFRYNFWNYFKYQIIVLREYTALLYYSYKGWI